MDVKEIQKRTWQNKVKHGFNTTDVPMEFCYLYGEVGEAYDAFLKNKDDLGSELADVALFLAGLSQMLGFDLEEEIIKKMEINEKREYKFVNGIPVKTTKQENVKTENKTTKKEEEKEA